MDDFRLFGANFNPSCKKPHRCFRSFCRGVLASVQEQGLTLPAFCALIVRAARHNLPVSVNPIRAQALVGMLP